MTELSFNKRNRDLSINKLIHVYALLDKEEDYGYNNINKKLYESCVAHRNKYTKKLSDNIVALVHHNFIDLVNTSLPKGLINLYNNNLERLIKTAKNNDWSVVLFTFPEAYKYHKKNLKKGVYDKAFFTEFGKGEPYKEDLSELENKSLFIAGCYGTMCVKDLIKELPTNKIKVVPQAIILRPSNYSGSDHERFWNKEKIKIISLNQLKLSKAFK